MSDEERASEDMRAAQAEWYRAGEPESGPTVDALDRARAALTAKNTPEGQNPE